MVEINDLSKSQQIRTLLFVLGSGIAAAFLFSFVLLYYYNPPGTYLAKNALIDPAGAMTMHFSEETVRGGDNTPFVFDGIEFSYFDLQGKQWKRVSIDLQKYNAFYQLVGNERSLREPSDEIKAKFVHGHPSNMTFRSRRENAKNGNSSDFLKVDFADEGDYYRIQLREHGEGEGWAYYYHPGIFKLMNQLFVK